MNKGRRERLKKQLANVEKMRDELGTLREELELEQKTEHFIPNSEESVCFLNAFIAAERAESWALLIAQNLKKYLSAEA